MLSNPHPARAHNGPADARRYVHIVREVAACPDCGGTDLKILRSTIQGGGSRRRRAVCRACNAAPFFVVVEIRVVGRGGKNF